MLHTENEKIRELGDEARFIPLGITYGRPSGMYINTTFYVLAFNDVMITSVCVMLKMLSCVYLPVILVHILSLHVVSLATQCV